MAREEDVERYSLQDDYERVTMTHSLELESSGRYEDALACLAAALEANSHRDHDKWLARSVARDRMMILVDAGRYAEALEASRDWRQIGFENVSQRWMHATATGHALEGLGRDEEAVAVLEDSLAYQDETYLPSVLGVLLELVRFSEKLGVPFNSKWLPIAEALASELRQPLDLATRHIARVDVHVPVHTQDSREQCFPEPVHDRHCDNEGHNRESDRDNGDNRDKRDTAVRAFGAEVAAREHALEQAERRASSIAHQYALAIRISSTAGAPEKMHAPKEDGCAIGAFRMVSFNAFRRVPTSSNAAPLGRDHCTRAQPLNSPSLSSVP